MIVKIRVSSCFFDNDSRLLLLLQNKQYTNNKANKQNQEKWTTSKNQLLLPANRWI